MKIAICDDEPPELVTLKTLIHNYSQERGTDFVLSSFHSGEDLLTVINSGVSFDIVILDVYIGQINGVSLARRLRELNRDCRLIFATNSPDHAIDGYSVRALEYLLKPVSQVAFFSAMDHALETIVRKTEPFVQVTNRQGTYKILLRDIKYAESNARVITIYSSTQDPINFYDKLDNFERLCDDARFLRCHKSFLVNLEYVHSILNSSVHMDNGVELKLSINPITAREIFAAYAANKI